MVKVSTRHGDGLAAADVQDIPAVRGLGGFGEEPGQVQYAG